MEKIGIETIIRSKRKTLSLEVRRDGALVVRAPLRASLGQIERLVFKKRFWIRRKRDEAKKKHQRIMPKEFVNGEGFLYLGNTYKLAIVENGDFPLALDKEFRLSRDCLARARSIFIKWYKEQAYQKISERARWYSIKAGLEYKGLRITDAQKRWGSCGTNGNLNFSWRLIMAPLPVIDYVVAHELVHLYEKNHSKRFWEKVKVMLPRYVESKEWLKENEHLLAI